MTILKKFFKDESGATAIEYGLLAAMIGVAGIVGFQLVGTNLLAMFNAIALFLVI